MKTRCVNTESLEPGDLVMGSERQELMLPPDGLYVERTEYNKQHGCTLVWWRGATRPEGFNPYYTWYVKDERKEQEDGTTEEGPF